MCIPNNNVPSIGRETAHPCNAARKRPIVCGTTSAQAPIETTYRSQIPWEHETQVATGYSSKASSPLFDNGEPGPESINSTKLGEGDKGDEVTAGASCKGSPIPRESYTPLHTPSPHVPPPRHHRCIQHTARHFTAG